MISYDQPSRLIPVYPFRLPVSFTRGQGIWLWEEGTPEPYLDALSGRGVCNLGHNHPQVVQTLKKQADQIIHTSNLYRISNQEKLAEILCEQFGMVQAFFSNSGAESIEAALKMAYFHSTKKSIQDSIIITLQGSYHGRTLGALKVSGSKQLISEKLALEFSKNMNSIVSIPLNDIEILHNTIEHYKKRVVAIFIEPILGDGGIQPCSYEFLQSIRQLCNEYDYLMIADEIQTGLCRTGPFSACESVDIQPDIITLAKALGNGFPIGAYLVNERAKDLLNGYHGSTFGGNPLGCAVALSVLETFNSENISSYVPVKGDYLKTKLQTLLRNYPMVRSIRGKGLMIGIELDHPCIEILEVALRHKLLFDVVSDNTIRLLPPLTITQKEMDELIKRLLDTFEDYFLLDINIPKNI